MRAACFGGAALVRSANRRIGSIADRQPPHVHALCNDTSVRAVTARRGACLHRRVPGPRPAGRSGVGDDLLLLTRERDLPEQREQPGPLHGGRLGRPRSAREPEELRGRLRQASADRPLAVLGHRRARAAVRRDQRVVPSGTIDARRAARRPLLRDTNDAHASAGGRRGALRGRCRLHGGPPEVGELPPQSVAVLEDAVHRDGGEPVGRVELLGGPEMGTLHPLGSLRARPQRVRAPRAGDSRGRAAARGRGRGDGCRFKVVGLVGD